MPFYHFFVKNNAISLTKGEIDEISNDFLKYEGKSFGESEIHYITKEGKVVEVIADTELGEHYAKAEVEDFLKNL
jgi:hypothetical protein